MLSSYDFGAYLESERTHNNGLTSKTLAEVHDFGYLGDPGRLDVGRR